MSLHPSAAAAEPVAGKRPTRGSAPRRVLRWLRFGNVSALYVWAAIIVVFSIWAPHTFPTWDTARAILNNNAITGLAALSIVVPLCARVFDLSIGNSMGLCAVVVAWLLTTGGLAPLPAIVLGVLLGLLLGLVNATIVVVAGIDSFIATLATGALMAAAVIAVTNEQAIVGDGLVGGFGDLAGTSIGGISITVLYMLGLAVLMWWLLEHTVTGRRIYATGFNEEAARLAGVRIKRLRFIALLTSATIAGFAGIVVASQVSSGSPDIGPPYLLDAFAAAFLGASQFREGRFNPAGTIVAVLLIGTGKYGLSLVGAPTWSSSMFSGVVLLTALGLTRLELLRASGRSLIDRRGRGRAAGATPTSKE
jgi:ribose transport system permease protein